MSVDNYPTCAVGQPIHWFNQQALLTYIASQIKIPGVGGENSGKIEQTDGVLEWEKLAGGASGCYVVESADKVYKFATTHGGVERVNQEFLNYQNAKDSVLGKYLISPEESGDGYLVLPKVKGKNMNEVLSQNNCQTEIWDAYSKLFSLEEESIFSDEADRVKSGEKRIERQSMILKELGDTYVRAINGGLSKQGVDSSEDFQKFKENQVLSIDGKKISLKTILETAVGEISKDPEELVFMYGDTTKDNVFFDDSGNIVLIDPEWVGYHDPFEAMVRTSKIKGFKTQKNGKYSNIIEMLQLKADNKVSEIAQKYEKESGQDANKSLYRHYLARVLSRWRSIIIRPDDPKCFEVEMSLIAKDYEKAMQYKKFLDEKATEIEINKAISEITNPGDLQIILKKYFDSEKYEGKKGFLEMIKSVLQVFPKEGLNSEDYYNKTIRKMYDEHPQKYLYHENYYTDLSNFGRVDIWTQATSLTDQINKVELANKIPESQIMYFSGSEHDENIIATEIPEAYIGSKLDWAKQVLESENRNIIFIDDRPKNIQKLREIRKNLHEQNKQLKVDFPNQNSCILIRIKPKDSESMQTISDDKNSYFEYEVDSIEQANNILIQHGLDKSQTNIFVDYDSTAHDTKLYKKDFCNHIYNDLINPNL